jgi:hypothetical protein
MRTGKLSSELLNGTSGLNVAALSADGSLLATATETALQVWDTRALRELATIPLGENSSNDLVFLPGARLAIAHYPGWILDLSTGALKSQACRFLAGRELSEAEWNRYVGTTRKSEPACPRSMGTTRSTKHPVKSQP